MENLQAQLLSLKKDDTPADPPKTFSEIFREEPLDKKSLLDSLKQNFVNITEVVRGEVFQHLAYDFYASPTGFWAIPPPAGYESMTLRPNSIGTFPELEAPTISAHWKPKAAADTHSYVAEERKEYRVPNDPLQKPTIPGRCVDPDMDKFLEGPALAVPDSSFNKGNNNLRRIKLNDKVFSKPSINWDTSWALPSFELKARLAARDGLQSTSMISDLSDRLCSLLSSLDGPFVWGPTGLICNEDGSYASSEGDIPLLESLSKLDLAEELRIAYKQLQLVLFQQDHQAHILRAAETEAKLGMRSLVLATDTSQNTALKDRLLKSRLSSVGLFGPAPENDESECQQNYWKKLVLKPNVFSPVPSWAGGSKTAGASKPPPGEALQTGERQGPAELNRDPTAIKLPIPNPRSPEQLLQSTPSVVGQGQFNHMRVPRQEARLPPRETKGKEERPRTTTPRRRKSSLGVFGVRAGVGRRDLHSHGLSPFFGPRQGSALYVRNLPLWRETDSFGSVKGRQTTSRLLVNGLPSHEDSLRSQIGLTSTGDFVRRSSPSRELDSGRKVEFSKFTRSSGLFCHGRSSQWTPSDLQGPAATSHQVEDGLKGHIGKYSRIIPDFSKADSLPDAIHCRMGERGHCDQEHPRNSRMGSHKSPVSRPKGQRQDPPYHRSFQNERVCPVSKVQDGASSEDHQGPAESFVGSKGRHPRCLFVNIDLRLLPKVFLFLDRKRDVHVQEDALRSHDCSLHLHQIDKNYQEVPQKEGSKHQLLHRRLPHLGEYSGKGNSSPQLDSASPPVVRLQNQPQEDLSISSAKINLSGRRSRSPKLDNEPSFRQDRPSSSGVHSVYPSHLGIKKGPGIPHWTSYIFVLGNSYWKNVCYPSNCVDEFAHMCGCERCSSFCYSLPAEAVETFLSSQFSKSKGLLQVPSSRSGLNDGCFRLWLEWGDPPLLRKGYLVGRGFYRLHQRERDESNHVLHAIHASHPDWKACGNPYRQHGSLFLFEENGFSPLPDPNSSYQGVSLFVSRSQHYIRGPTYSGKTQCPCGRGLKTLSQCHRQLSGPGDFLVCFTSGLLRFSHSGRLMCYIGEYEVQVLCLSMPGSEPVLCRRRCENCRLVTVQSDLSFSSCFDPRFSSSQDRGLSRESTHHSSPYWPCLSGSLEKSPLVKKTPRVFFPFSVSPEWRDDQETHVL